MALSEFELCAFGYKEQRSFGVSYSSPTAKHHQKKKKKTGLRSIRVVMLETESPGKLRTGAAVESRLPKKRSVRHLYPRWRQGPLTSRNSWVFTFELYHQCDRDSPCVPTPLHLLASDWGYAFPKETGMGPDHHVMPGIDMGVRSANRLTVPRGWNPFSVGPVSGHLMRGNAEGSRYRMGSPMPAGAGGAWAQETYPTSSIRPNFYLFPHSGLLSEAKATVHILPT